MEGDAHCREWYLNKQQQQTKTLTLIFCSDLQAVQWTYLRAFGFITGEAPSKTLVETAKEATEKAKETALAATEKAKDLASKAATKKKQQYVWKKLSFPAVGNRMQQNNTGRLTCL